MEWTSLSSINKRFPSMIYVNAYQTLNGAKEQIENCPRVFSLGVDLNICDKLGTDLVQFAIDNDCTLVDKLEDRGALYVKFEKPKFLLRGNKNPNDERLCSCGKCRYCEIQDKSDYDYEGADYVCSRCNGAGCTKCEE